MRAREWVVAYRYYTPEDYGIPALPDWAVERIGSGGVSFVADDEAFVRAERPVTVRR